MTGRLIGIARAPERGAPLVELEAASVTVEAGIDGDARGTKPGRQVTVLFREGWDDACEELGVALPWVTRRANLFVEDVDRPRAAGGRLSVGGVTLEVTQETATLSSYGACADGLAPRNEAGLARRRVLPCRPRRRDLRVGDAVEFVT